MTILAAFVGENGQIIHAATNHTSSSPTLTTLDSLLHLRAQARTRHSEMNMRTQT